MSASLIRIPLFPLGMVLFPGLVLPLQLFEERYLALARDLLDEPDPARRRFGVVAIRRGREVGVDSAEDLYEWGTTATVSELKELPDGRFQMVTVGTDRFRLHSVLRPEPGGRPYLQAEVEFTDDSGDGESSERSTDEAQALVPGVRAAYAAYLTALGASRNLPIDMPDLPDDPQVLSHFVAASVVIDLPVRQRLLEAPDVASRLAQETALLREESRLLSAVSAAPAPDLARAPQSPN